MVDYKLLTEMLEAALAKETSESWNIIEVQETYII